MKKIFNFCVIALVAMVALTACEKDYIEVDYSNNLVSTWTCLEANYAEALIFKADGSILSTGVEDGEYWEDVKGTWTVKNNKMTMIFEDDDNFDGSFDLIPGETLSLLGGENNERTTYKFCKEDLSDKIIGMWVCNDDYTASMNDMVIYTYNKDGYSYKTGWSSGANDFIVKNKSSYKVVGDLLFVEKLSPTNGQSKYVTSRLVYSQNGTSLGDILTHFGYMFNGKEVVEITTSWLRVKETLKLTGKKYNYNNLYITNVKGLDRDINFMGYTMNFANMDGYKLDAMLKSILFGFEFPDANSINYSYQLNGAKDPHSAPIEVEGNKLTVKVSENEPTLKDVVFYAFQDADDCQMHIYMHRNAFVNFYTNMQASLMAAQDPMFDITDQAAIDAIYNSINEAVETINLSIVMK